MGLILEARGPILLFFYESVSGVIRYSRFLGCCCQTIVVEAEA